MLKSVVKYSATLYSFTYINAFLSLISLAVFSRFLTPEDLGIYALFGLYLSYSQVFFGYGVFRTTVKFVGAGDDKEEVILYFLGIFIFMLTATLTISSIVLSIFINNYIAAAIFCTAPTIGMQVSLSYYRAKFQAKKEILTTTSRCILFFLFTMSIILIYTCCREVNFLDQMLTLFDHKLFMIPIIGEACSLIVISTINYRQIYKENIKSKICEIKIEDVKSMANKYLHFGFPMWISNNASRINDIIDQFAVKHFLGITVLGEYYLAIRFYEIIDRPIGIVSRVLLSAFARNDTRTRDTYDRALSANLAIFPTSSLIVVSLAPITTKLLFSDAYQNVAMLFALMSFSYVFQSVEMINGVITITEGHPKINQQSQLCTLALNFPVTYGLISRFNVFGAAASKGIQRGIFLFFIICFMRKTLPWHSRRSAKKTVKAFSLYLVLFLFIISVNFNYLSLITVGAYLILGHLFKIFDLKDLWSVMTKSIKKG